jgi:hypothetical protein
MELHIFKVILFRAISIRFEWSWKYDIFICFYSHFHKIRISQKKLLAIFFNFIILAIKKLSLCSFNYS